jgi:hypothetical protein
MASRNLPGGEDGAHVQTTVGDGVGAGGDVGGGDVGPRVTDASAK